MIVIILIEEEDMKNQRLVIFVKNGIKWLKAKSNKSKWCLTGFQLKKKQKRPIQCKPWNRYYEQMSGWESEGRLFR